MERMKAVMNRLRRDRRPLALGLALVPQGSISMNPLPTSWIRILWSSARACPRSPPMTTSQHSKELIVENSDTVSVVAPF